MLTSGGSALLGKGRIGRGGRPEARLGRGGSGGRGKGRGGSGGRVDGGMAFEPGTAAGGMTEEDVTVEGVTGVGGVVGSVPVA